MSRATVNYTTFISQISQKLASKGVYNEEWFNGQRKRLSMMWNAGETIDSAFETIESFASAQLGKESIKPLNPLSMPLCIGVRYI